MNLRPTLVGATLALITVACGGSSRIGEAGTTGGAGGEGNGGNAGTSMNGGAGGTATGGTATGGAATGGAATGGTATGGTATGGAGGSGATSAGAALPCNILGNAGLTCVAAHSTVRVLVDGYTGRLYQVRRGTGETEDIGADDGYADVAAHDAFCSSGGCVVTILYDQTANGNHLTPAPPGSAKPTPANPAIIGDLPTPIAGNRAYGLRFRPGQGYRAACRDCPYPEGPPGTAEDDTPQTIYMVTSRHDLVNGCCFDYGNGERTQNNDGNGATEAVYFGSGVIWGTGTQGDGPWVMADLENGLYAGWENGQDRNISTNTPLLHDFVTAVLVGDTAAANNGRGRFALYGGDATSGPLKTMYDGIRPEKPGYVPMVKQGSIVLSVAGDNSDGDGGRFYEGVIANGAATQATLDALQAGIVAAGYGR